MRDKQDVYGAQVEFVVEGEGSKAFIGGVDASVEHDSLPLVLNNVAGATNLVAAAETEKGKKVRFILNWGRAC